MTPRQILPLVARVTARVPVRIGSKSLQSLNCAGVRDEQT
jgi:hypothetical protein